MTTCHDCRTRPATTTRRERVGREVVTRDFCRQCARDFDLLVEERDERWAEW